MFRLLLWLSLTLPLSAQLKVLVLDFQNIGNHKDYAYLKASLGDAVKQDLREHYDFAETPEPEWRLIAKENYLSEEDFFTKSVILNLGLLARQDLVISGSFAPVPGSKPPILLNKVRIADINRKEIIREFEITLPASSNLFKELKLVTQRIVQELKDILPSKKDYTKSDIGDFHLAKDHEWGFKISYSVFSPRATSTQGLSSGSDLFPYTIAPGIRIDADYRRHNFRKGNFIAGAEINYELSQRSLPTEKNTQDTKITQHSFAGHALLAHETLLSGRWAFVPAILAGYAVHSMTRDYSALTTYPLDPDSGRAENTVNQLYTSPSLGVRISMQYRITGSLGIDFGIANYSLLFANGVDNRTYVTMGSSLRI